MVVVNISFKVVLYMRKAGENFDYSCPVKRVIGNFVLQKKVTKK